MADLPLGRVYTFDASIASGASISTIVDLGGAWTNVYLDYPSPGAAINLFAAPTSTGTYDRVFTTNSHTVESVFTIASSASGGITKVPVEGLRYVKVGVTATAANGASFTFICS